VQLYQHGVIDVPVECAFDRLQISLVAVRGIYVRLVEGRFGTRAQDVEQLIESVAAQCGETIVCTGAAAAAALGGAQTFVESKTTVTCVMRRFLLD
jgi:hypothetical protein